MRILFILLLFAGTSIALDASNSTLAIKTNFTEPTDTLQLTVNFTNVKKEWYGKKMYMAVWKKGTKGFPDVGTQDKYHTFWVKSEKKSGAFELSKGTYALSCYLDLNGNKKLDYNIWGAPREPYCFSNNFTPSFSAPDFSDCDFYLSVNKEIKLKLIY